MRLESVRQWEGKATSKKKSGKLCGAKRAFSLTAFGSNFQRSCKAGEARGTLEKLHKLLTAQSDWVIYNSDERLQLESSK